MASSFFDKSLNGFISLSINSSRFLLSIGISIWLSAKIPPWPGKCFPVDFIPASCIPSIYSDANLITSLELFEKDLSPIILEVDLSTSRTGAKFMSMPTDNNSEEISHPVSLNKESSL